MRTGMIEHWGMVKRIDDGRPAALPNLPATSGLKEGDFVKVGLAESRLSLAAMLGYLFPVLATLAGALIGLSSGGNDSATALGAAAGFVGSLVVARIAINFTPGPSPAPQLIPHSSLAAPFPQE